MRKPLAVVSVSGGKDSTAVALLAIEELGVENCRFVFADTGHEHQLTVEYVQQYLPAAFNAPVETVKADFSREIANKRIYVEQKWPAKGVPDEIVKRALSVLYVTGVPYLDLCLWKGRFPSRTRQFCTQHLKRIPLDNYILDRIAEGFECESWRGIRRDESQNRKDAKDREATPEGYTIVHRIVDWTAQQVIDYVLGKGVKLNPLYSLGMRRVGCMPCINVGKDELLETSKRFPEYIEIIREWERLVSLAAKRGWTTFFTDSALESPTPRPGWIYERRPLLDEAGAVLGYSDVWVEPDEEIHERCRVDKRIEWAQTSHGGKQLDFIRLEPVQACASVYGLCE